MAAFRALHQDDRMFRGLALEYLENILPDDMRRRLWVILGEPTQEEDTKSGMHQKALEELLVTDARLVRVLKELRKEQPAEQAPPPES